MKKTLFLTLTIAAIALLSGVIFANGTETLGDPDITIAAGSGIVAAGTGMEVQPGTITLDVPGSVAQALLYWSGAAVGANPGDDTILVNGTAVTGSLIGGPAYFFTCPAGCTITGDYYFSTYRADITGLGLVSSGANVLSLTGMNFGPENNGAGLMVIYDDGSQADIHLKDGIDLAYFGFPEPRRSTVPQTITFAADSQERTAELTIFAGSVGGTNRPNTIDITIAGTTTTLVNPLGSYDGDYWDTLVVPVTIPAGATELTVQVVSTPGEDPRGASLTWSAAGLSIPEVTPPGGGQGCTPGYWKQPHHFDSWVGYDPGDDYETVFGVTASFHKTLLGALRQGGGQEKALGRHAVAALLNAANPDVSYLYTEAEVIAMVQEAYATGDFNGIKDLFEEQNEIGCPLN